MKELREGGGEKRGGEERRTTNTVNLSECKWYRNTLFGAINIKSKFD